MARTTLALLAIALTGLLLFGCASSDPVAEEPADVGDEPVAEAPLRPTAENPFVLDEENGALLVYAEVNRKWVTEPTRHAVVSSDGSNGENAIFRAGGNALEFNELLFALGAEAGENVKKDSPAGTKVEGSEFDVTVAWDGDEYALADLVVASGELADNGFTWKFGGNYEFQGEARTGCLLCLDSCAAGIVSNAEIGWQSFASGLVEFRGDGDLLPADGTPVVITYTLR